MSLLFNPDEAKILQSAFQASDIDGDGVLSHSDLQISSRLTDFHDVNSLFQAFKRGNTGDFITFEEFSRGVMDFPFLLEQYKEELKERKSQGRDSGPILNIDVIEEMEIHGENKQKVRVWEVNCEYPVLSKKAIMQAYGCFSGLLSHRSTLSWTGSDNDVSLESYVEMTKHLLGKIQNNVGANDKIQETLIKGSLKAVEQVDHCVKTLNLIKSTAETRETELVALNSELQKRCEMSEIRANVLFDRVKVLETEILEEQKHRQIVQQESSHFQDLLKSAHKQGEKTTQDLNEILCEIEGKEREIMQLQQDIRRLNSRKVLKEIADSEDGDAAMEIRTIRRERKTVEGVRDAGRGRTSEDVIVSFHSPPSRLPPHPPQSPDPNPPLKLKETELEAHYASQISLLQSELQTTKQRLFSCQTHCQELEEELEGIPVHTTFSTGPDDMHKIKLSWVTMEVAKVKPQEKRMDKVKEERSDCCLSF